MKLGSRNALDSFMVVCPFFSLRFDFIVQFDIHGQFPERFFAGTKVGAVAFVPHAHAVEPHAVYPCRTEEARFRVGIFQGVQFFIPIRIRYLNSDFLNFFAIKILGHERLPADEKGEKGEDKIGAHLLVGSLQWAVGSSAHCLLIQVAQLDLVRFAEIIQWRERNRACIFCHDIIIEHGIVCFGFDAGRKGLHAGGQIAGSFLGHDH